MIADFQLVALPFRLPTQKLFLKAVKVCVPKQTLSQESLTQGKSLPSLALAKPALPLLQQGAQHQQGELLSARRCELPAYVLPKLAFLNATARTLPLLLQHQQ